MSCPTPWLREIWKHVRQLARQVYAPHYMSKDIFSIQVFCDTSLPHLPGVPGPRWTLQYTSGKLRRARRKRKERGSAVTSSTVATNTRQGSPTHTRVLQHTLSADPTYRFSSTTIKNPYSLRSLLGKNTELRLFSRRV